MREQNQALVPGEPRAGETNPKQSAIQQPIGIIIVKTSTSTGIDTRTNKRGPAYDLQQEDPCEPHPRLTLQASSKGDTQTNC